VRNNINSTIGVLIIFKITAKGENISPIKADKNPKMTVILTIGTIITLGRREIIEML
jgi:hypothetical protein